MSNAGFNKLVRVQEVSNTQKFVAFNLGGITDTIIVGLACPELPLGDPKQCLSIAYKGEVTLVPFTATSDDIRDINWGKPTQVEVDLFLQNKLKETKSDSRF